MEKSDRLPWTVAFSFPNRYLPAEIETFVEIETDLS